MVPSGSGGARSMMSRSISGWTSRRSGLRITGYCGKRNRGILKLGELGDTASSVTVKLFRLGLYLTGT